MIQTLRKIYFEWLYRRVDARVCCCGETIGTGGSICGHGGCRSEKEYAITSALAQEPACLAHLKAGFARVGTALSRAFARTSN